MFLPKAAIFDLDGTLLDSMWCWRKIDADFLASRGHIVTPDYTDAIKSAVGSGLVKQNDQKVIQACDAVYAKHKSDYGSSISGTIQITHSKLGDSNSEQVIKEYTY